MFAHQVIDDLQKFDDPEYFNPKVRDDICRNIMVSQHFHFGSVSNLEKLTEFKNGTPILQIHKFKPPYNSCWFDFLYDTPGAKEHQRQKLGCLIYKKNDKWRILFFEYFLDIKTWVPHPIYFAMKESDEDVEIWSNPFFPELLPSNEIGAFIHGPEGIVPGIVDMALMLLNCKNIETARQVPSDQLNKKRMARGRTPLFTYHTLYIKLLDQKTKCFKRVNPTDIHNRIHLCRGHFKAYPMKSPLFGKYVGLWWWQPIVRGQNKKGIVLKDYELK